MRHDFLIENRTELIDRCRLKVAARRAPRATPAELEHGIPLFLDQLTGMLPAARSAIGVGPSSGPAAESRMERGATRHGRELLRNDFSIDQVVHDYGDLCQSIMEIASAQGRRISVEDFAILNGRLDNAIAGAVAEYARRREDIKLEAGQLATHEVMAALAGEMRSLLNTAIVAITAIKGGGAGFGGATASALDRSLIGMHGAIDRLLAQSRVEGVAGPSMAIVDLSAFIGDVRPAAALEARLAGCELAVTAVDEGIFMEVDPEPLASALAVLLREACRASGPDGVVMLGARSVERRVLIEIQDANPEADRWDAGAQAAAFALVRERIEASGGRMFSRQPPRGTCVATIAVPRKSPLGLP